MEYKEFKEINPIIYYQKQIVKKVMFRDKVARRPKIMGDELSNYKTICKKLKERIYGHGVKDLVWQLSHRVLNTMDMLKKMGKSGHRYVPGMQIKTRKQ